VNSPITPEIKPRLGVIGLLTNVEYCALLFLSYVLLSCYFLNCSFFFFLKKKKKKKKKKNSHLRSLLNSPYFIYFSSFTSASFTLNPCNTSKNRESKNIRFWKRTSFLHLTYVADLSSWHSSRNRRFFFFFCECFFEKERNISFQLDEWTKNLAHKLYHVWHCHLSWWNLLLIWWLTSSTLCSSNERYSAQTGILDRIIQTCQSWRQWRRY
jgi:hypothetical protein